MCVTVCLGRAGSLIVMHGRDGTGKVSVSWDTIVWMSREKTFLTGLQPMGFLCVPVVCQLCAGRKS